MSLTIKVPDDFDIYDDTINDPKTPELMFDFDEGEFDKIEEKIVCLDLDETMVHCPRLSIWMNVFGHYNDLTLKENKEILKGEIKVFLEMGGLRPGVKKLIQTLNNLLLMKKLDRVGIFTSATNKNNYVNYLKLCIEELSGVPENTISFLMTREHGTKIARDGSTIKDLYEVYNLFYKIETMADLYGKYSIKKVVILDDKPYNVAQYSCGYYDENIIGISQYNKDINYLDFIKKINLDWCNKNKLIKLLELEKIPEMSEIPEDIKKELTIAITIINDEKTYPYNYDYHSNDEMYKKIEQIKEIFM